MLVKWAFNSNMTDLTYRFFSIQTMGLDLIFEQVLVKNNYFGILGTSRWYDQQIIIVSPWTDLMRM